MGRPKNPLNLFKPTPVPKSSSAKQGDSGYDNPRENIDPKVSTKKDVEDLTKNHPHQDVTTTASPTFIDITGTTYNGMFFSVGANNFGITRGTTDLEVTADCDINQNLSTTSSPTFDDLTATGVVNTGNGAVATPAYSFTDDTGAGMWYVTSGNRLRFATEGVNRMSVNDEHLFMSVPIAVDHIKEASASHNIVFDNDIDFTGDITFTTNPTINYGAGSPLDSITFNGAGIVASKVEFTGDNQDGSLSMTISDSGTGFVSVGNLTFTTITPAAQVSFLSTGAGGFISFNADDNVRIIAGDFDVEAGRISSGQTTITADEANFDVSGVNSIMIIPGVASIELDGLSGGIAGQVIHFAYSGLAAREIVFKHNSGTQKLMMHTGADETIDGGGFTFVCDGTNWYDASHARHV